MHVCLSRRCTQRIYKSLCGGDKSCDTSEAQQRYLSQGCHDVIDCELTFATHIPEAVIALFLSTVTALYPVAALQEVPGGTRATPDVTLASRRPPIQTRHEICIAIARTCRPPHTLLATPLTPGVIKG